MSVKRVITVLLLLVLVCSSVVVFAGCYVDTSNYTLEQHKEIVSQKVEKFISNENSRSQQVRFTGFQLYPLYNENDEWNYFLVEFEPYGFMFVRVSSITSRWEKLIGVSHTVYYHDADYLVDDAWQRYRVGVEESLAREQSNWSTDSESYYKERYFEVNSDNEFIKYTSSPFKVADVLDEKLYYLDVDVGYIPAIKIDGKYFNLISLQEIEYNKEGVSFYEKHNDYVVNNMPYLARHFYAENQLRY